MKKILMLSVIAAAFAWLLPAQTWRRSLQNLPDRPASGVTVRDIERVEEDLRMAAPYLGAATPENWEANREIVRRTVTYLAAVRAMNNDPLVRTALMRTFRMVTAMRLAYPENQEQPRQNQAAAPAPASQPLTPRAPLFDTVPDADNQTAEDLRTRYDLAAAQAGVAVQLADAIQRNLESRGMTLNAATATSLARIRVYFDHAATALEAHKWVDARTNLERAEYETEKVLKTVGR